MFEGLKRLLSKPKIPDFTPALSGAIVGRHGEKPTNESLPSLRYPGISTKGAEEVKTERASEIIAHLEKSPKGTVLFISGVPVPKEFPQNPALQRTRSTAIALGDGIKTRVQGRNDIEVMTYEEIEDMRRQPGSKVTHDVAARIKAEPQKKFVVDFPMFLNELSVKPWLNPEGTNWSEYQDEIMTKHNDNEYEAMKEWIRTGGTLEINGKILACPSPRDTAEGFIEAIKRLREFAQKQIGDRPVIIGITSHGWLADAFIIWAATGKLDETSMDQVMSGRGVDQSELAFVESSETGRSVLFRGHRFQQSP